MFAQNVIDYDPDRASDALNSLLEMKASIPTSVIQQRASKRIEVRTKVIAKPGNSSQRNTHSIEGVTGDISRDGCQIVFPQTIAVGDIFWLEFSQKTLVKESVLARCVRCCFIREDTFETGFRFFERINIRNYS